MEALLLCPRLPSPLRLCPLFSVLARKGLRTLMGRQSTQPLSLVPPFAALLQPQAGSAGGSVGLRRLQNQDGACSGAQRSLTPPGHSRSAVGLQEVPSLLRQGGGVPPSSADVIKAAELQLCTSALVLRLATPPKSVSFDITRWWKSKCTIYRMMLFSSMYYLLLVHKAQTLNQQASTFSAPGDYVIGGLFPIHSDVLYVKDEFEMEVPICTNFYASGYRHLLAMKYAIHEINNSPTLLPNITLGYDFYDTCSDSLASVTAVLDFLSMSSGGTGLQSISNHTDNKSQLLAIIHPGSSDAILGGTRLLSFLSIPQVTYSPTSESTYGTQYVFQTAPSSKSHAEALVKLVTYFHWNWISIIGSNDPFSFSLMEHFANLAKASETCIAYQGVIPTDDSSGKTIYKIVDDLDNSQVNVTILFASDVYVAKLMWALTQRNFTGKVWVAGDDWSTSDMITSIPNLSRLGTFIGFLLRRGNIQGFREYVELILEDKISNPALVQNCSYEDSSICSECQNLTLSNVTDLLGNTSYQMTYNVYSAVYVVATALHQLLSCNQSVCLSNEDKQIYLWQLMEEMTRVNISIGSAPIYISNIRDPPAMYDLITWRWESSNTFPNFQVIGSYDPIGKMLQINSSAIQWNVERNKIPPSNCSYQCEPGQRRRMRSYYSCCYTCENCPAGYFQNLSADPSTCTPCLPNQWSPEKSTECYGRDIEYLDWSDTVTILIMSLCHLLLLLTVCIFVLFTVNLRSPIVKASGRISSLLLLLALTSCLCSCSLFIGEPTIFLCEVRQPAFSVSFTVCLSLLLGKTLQVSNLCSARSACFKGCIIPMCFLLCLFSQASLCCAWFYFNPPTLLEDLYVSASSLLIECSEGSFTGFGLPLSFNAFVALLCFMSTFLGQIPSQPVNQSKQITYAMLIYFVAWIFFIPTYATSTGKLVPLFQVFSGVVSASGILGFYFSPKCYYLLFQPTVNIEAQPQIQETQEAISRKDSNMSTNDLILQEQQDPRSPDPQGSVK
ncbi:taste receptor type 1 member 3 [Discoglossus pictus]